MQYHIDRNGQRYGPYSLEEINTYLASGVLLPTDQAWYEGAPGWMNVTEVPGVIGTADPGAPPPPPPVLSGSQETGSIPVQICFPGEWMMVDSEVQLLLDGQPLQNFSFINGFNMNTTVSAGAHQLKTVVTFGPITRTKEFQFNCRGTESQLALTLEYSRLWGNFSDLRIA